MTTAEPLTLDSKPLHRQPPALAKPSFYRPELDALRFFAFLAVFITHVMPRDIRFYHENLHLPSAVARLCANAAWAGMGGVVLFFMLSSYLITALLLREHAKTGTIALGSFYTRRALRIWPLYFSFLAVCLFVLPHFGLPALDGVQRAGFATFCANWVIYFHGLPSSPATLLWSVSVEEQFYLVWPLLILAVGIKRLPLAALACIPVAALARWLMVQHGAQSLLLNGVDEWKLWPSSLSHVDSIAVGALLAYGFRNGLPKWSGVVRVAMLTVGVALPVIARGGWGELYRYPAVTTASALIVLGVLGFDLPKNKMTGALVYLGKISFGLYVVHIAFHLLADHLIPKLIFVAPATLIFSIVAAAISYRWLETPFLRLKERFTVVKSRSI